jgi:hypothetical protein
MSELGVWSTYPQPIPKRGPGGETGVIHAAMMRTGRVLFITADETTLVWNPEDATPAAFQDPVNQPHTMPRGYSQLCGHHVFLSDGRLLSVGGGGYAAHHLARAGYTFDPVALSWARTANDMSHHRWYPTAVALGDGRVLVVCGHGAGDVDVYDERTDSFTAVSLELLPFPSLYPGLHLVPDDHVFYSRTGWASAGPGGTPFQHRDDQSAYLDMTGPATAAWTTIAPAPADTADRTKGMSALLVARDPTTRVIVLGGVDPATNGTYETIDVSGLSPSSAWSSRVPFPDGQRRSLGSAVLLPDGRVFVAGGVQARNSPCAIFDPATDAWTAAAQLPSERDYHSVAVLLPSGRVMMAGWRNTAIEIYDPPYLFRGPRPAIAAAPAAVRHGEPFTVETPDAGNIAAVTLVRPTAVTHQTDSEQRVLDLRFEPAGANRLRVTAPHSPVSHALAPPGYYMLFVIDGDGVPSVARWIRVGTAIRPGWRPIGDPAAGHVVPQRSVVYPASRRQERVDVFVVGNNGGIYTSGRSGLGAWETWHPIGDPAAGRNVPTRTVASAVSAEPDRLDVFVVGHNEGIYTSGQTGGGAWEDWHPIGDPAAGNKVPHRSVVTPVSSNPGRVDVFVVGHNGGIYTSGRTGAAGGWEPWHPIGDPAAGHNVPTNSIVSAVSAAPGRIDVFVVGTNGGIYTSGQTSGGAWEAWHPIGDPAAGHDVPTRSPVTAVSREPGRIDIFVVGKNRGIYTSGRSGGAPWEAWHPVGNPAAGHVVPHRSTVWPVSRDAGRIDLFVVGDNGGIYTSGQTGGGGWETWGPVGDPAAGHTVPPGTVVGAVSPVRGAIDLFVVGTNGGIYTHRLGV